MIRALGFCLVAAFAAVLPSCIGFGGTVNNHNPTKGQELIDLKTALDQGAINQTEYDQKRKQILTSQ